MENMDGLWVVEFSSSIGLFGRGVIILNGQRILGGDMGFYYSGKCILNGCNIKGEVDVIRFDPEVISVFGDIESFTLSINGTIKGTDLRAKANSDSFPSIQMEIKGSKKEDL